MKWILLIISILLSYHDRAFCRDPRSYSSLEEFSNDLKPKLTADEKALLEPVLGDDFMSFKFKKEGTITLLGGTKNGDEVMFSGSYVSTVGPVISCKYKEFQFRREATFTKQGFILRHVAMDPEGPETL